MSVLELLSSASVVQNQPLDNPEQVTVALFQ